MISLSFKTTPLAPITKRPQIVPLKSHKFYPYNLPHSMINARNKHLFINATGDKTDITLYTGMRGKRAGQMEAKETVQMEAKEDKEKNTPFLVSLQNFMIQNFADAFAAVHSWYWTEHFAARLKKIMGYAVVVFHLFLIGLIIYNMFFTKKEDEEK